METLSEHNIEAWFLDYLEDRLNKTEKVAFFEFLKHHPTLLKKFNNQKKLLKKNNTFYSINYNLLQEFSQGKNIIDYEDSNLYSALKHPTPSKDAPSSCTLKTEILYKVYLKNLEAWENLCIASLEGDLSPQQQNELDEMLKIFPWLEKDYQLFKEIKFAPDVAVFPNKARLKRKHPWIKLYWAGAGLAAAAAVIALLIFTSPPGQIQAPSFEMHNSSPIATPMDQALIKSKSKNIEKKSFTTRKNAEEITVQTHETKRRVQAITPMPSRSAVEIEGVITYQNTIEPINRIYTAIYADMIERWQYEAQRENKSLGSVLMKPIKTLLGKTAEALPGRQPISLWTLAEFTLKGVNTLTNNNIELQTVRDEKGQLKALAVGNENFRIAHLKKNRPKDIEVEENTIQKDMHK